VLELRGVTYRYAGYANPALHDVYLTLHDGEIVGLVGGNEAGKSTICLVASGLAPLSIGGELRGEVLVDGLATAGLPVHELAERVVIGFHERSTPVK
jgi:energy-coupling factor transporter ATP-binding protein EcfA2